jgi:hypothetical protein
MPAMAGHARQNHRVPSGRSVPEFFQSLRHRTERQETRDFDPSMPDFLVHCNNYFALPDPPGTEKLLYYCYF